MRFLRNAYILWKDLYRLLFFLPEEKRLLRLLQKSHRIPSGGGKVLVQMVEDYRFLGKFVLFLRAWVKRSDQGVDIDWFWVLIPFRHNRSAKSYILEEMIRRPFGRRKWQKLFRALGGKVVFSNAHPPMLPGRDLTTAISRLGTLEDVLSLEFRGILIGDLIYDTYLRFTCSSTVRLTDPFLTELVEWAMRLTIGYQQLFEKNKYNFLLTSYTSYIQHGVPARVALQKGVPVYAMGAPNQLIVRPTGGFPYHKRNFHRYREWFDGLSAADKVAAVKKGHAGLENRLSGERDNATFYMRQSAYSKNSGPNLAKILPPKNKKTILIFGHDFFDSPHIYGKMVFPDFFIWLETTLEELKATEFEVLVKPHPNGLEGNEPLYRAFAKRFPHAQFLPAEVSSLSLVERGVDLAVTVYGTVAHELAYLGVPVLCCAENPHSSFTFCTTVESLSEYVSLLKNPDKVMRLNPHSDEVAAFYYVHSCRSLKGEMAPFPFVVSCGGVTRWLEVGSEEFKSRLLICEESLAAVNSI